MAEHSIHGVVRLRLGGRVRADNPGDVDAIFVKELRGLSQAGQICLNSRELAVSGIVRVVGLVITRIGD